MKDALISRISLKQSIAISAILKDKKTLEQIIDEEPSVDTVPVVRCKDCKYLFKVKNGIFVTYGCERNWCCYAERRE